MKPVYSYATALMGWTYKSFKDNMNRFGYTYHGADGKIGYFTLEGLSEIDIDEEDDLSYEDWQMKRIDPTMTDGFHEEEQED